MPTAIAEEVNEQLAHIRTEDAELTIPGSRDIYHYHQVFIDLCMIELLCLDQDPLPVYWEGVAKTRITKGDIARSEFKETALKSYSEALFFLTAFPFSDETAKEQAPLIRHVLWERFLVASILEDQAVAVKAAWDALDGVSYAFEELDSVGQTVCRETQNKIRVTGLVKRMAIRRFLCVTALTQNNNRK